ncbi:hypothetical protein PsYK624_087010 [Phanerochaete sordida]|uniref:Uncharacterized protein n=1 Tax=Phanerochaete sordida TaxID=48140 RepID=A0A9P3LEH9_9APHY|nr:hypothetical protein PsYK624_087010 [Phanerochaete sordida]
MLRPRYRPGWRPSWLDDLYLAPKKCEDYSSLEDADVRTSETASCTFADRGGSTSRDASTPLTLRADAWC